MKRIIIANQELGIVTQTGDRKLWSTSMLASQEACAFSPAEAVSFLRNCLPEGATPKTFVLPVTFDGETLPKGHELLRPLAHLWMLKIVSALITGTHNGKPIAVHTCWRGNTEAFELGKHMAAFEASAKKEGIQHPVIYNEEQAQVLEQALARVTENDTTPLTLLQANNTARIRELIQSIEPDAHPVKVARALQQVREHIANGNTIH